MKEEWRWKAVEISLIFTSDDGRKDHMDRILPRCVLQYCAVSAGCCAVWFRRKKMPLVFCLCCVLSSPIVLKLFCWGFLLALLWVSLAMRAASQGPFWVLWQTKAETISVSRIYRASVGWACKQECLLRPPGYWRLSKHGLPLSWLSWLKFRSAHILLHECGIRTVFSLLTKLHDGAMFFLLFFLPNKMHHQSELIRTAHMTWFDTIFNLHYHLFFALLVEQWHPPTFGVSLWRNLVVLDSPLGFQREGTDTMIAWLSGAKHRVVCGKVHLRYKLGRDHKFLLCN